MVIPAQTTRTNTSKSAPIRSAAWSAGTPNVQKVQAVLWDMDGTIVDTEPYWIKAENELVSTHGGIWDTHQAEALVGQALEFSAGVLQQAGVRLTIRQIIDHLTREVAARVRDEVPWRPGARELLGELHDLNVPCAMVTMSEKPLAELIAAQLPPGTFELLVTGDMVDRGKPDPEAYLMAFDALAAPRNGILKDNVIAIEDSLPGVTAAQASGVVTLAVPHFVPLPPDALRNEWTTLAGRTVADLNELLSAGSGGAR